MRLQRLAEMASQTKTKRESLALLDKMEYLFAHDKQMTGFSPAKREISISDSGAFAKIYMTCVINGKPVTVSPTIGDGVVSMAVFGERGEDGYTEFIPLRETEVHSLVKTVVDYLCERFGFKKEHHHGVWI